MREIFCCANLPQRMNTTCGRISETVRINRSFIHLPVALQYLVIKKLQAEAGLQLGYMVSAEEKYGSSSYHDISEYYKKTDLRWLVGLAYALNNNMMIKRDESGKILRQNFRSKIRSKIPPPSSSAGKAGTVTTFTLRTTERINLDKFNAWVSELLQNQGADLFRIKGLLHMQGYSDYVFVAQGVHMIFDGERRLIRAEEAQGERESRLVFIGRDLDREEIEGGVASTLCGVNP
ncbi:MAG: GTP-binding protein [Sphingobacteriales bacterium]|nr:MAG: GTP-binding protein [Sphingobacteriales bacterium]